uniref:Haloacid dehalogenase-like hydrolase family protein n=1 Tax=Arundo donax TaxID=35708 RepID=A0A0A9EXL4_ARUDO
MLPSPLHPSEAFVPGLSSMMKISSISFLNRLQA